MLLGLRTRTFPSQHRKMFCHGGKRIACETLHKPLPYFIGLQLQASKLHRLLEGGRLRPAFKITSQLLQEDTPLSPLAAFFHVIVLLPRTGVTSMLAVHSGLSFNSKSPTPPASSPSHGPGHTLRPSADAGHRRPESLLSPAVNVSRQPLPCPSSPSSSSDKGHNKASSEQGEALVLPPSAPC